MTRTRALTLLALALTLLLAEAKGAHAQRAEAVTEGATAGYELALNGATRGERGHALTLVGVGYEVGGLADLRARAGLELDALITARQGSGRGRRTVSRSSARTEGGGRFVLRVDMPSEELTHPRLELILHRPGQPGRRFVYSITPIRDEGVDLLTDRNRYQPGEQVRAWLRVRGVRAHVPHTGRPVRLALMDGAGQLLADHEAETGASGVVTAELTLPESAEAGAYRVVATLTDGAGPSATRNIQVWRRTVERLMAEIEIEHGDEDGLALVRPGGELRGRVLVRTPSGTPVRGATVELRVRPDAPPTTLDTGDDGTARFTLTAPAFLAGEVGRETLSARVVHAAYGTITASAGYLMARVPAIVSVSARGGALIPEVDSTLYVSVSDPRGRPLASGTEVVVRGPGLAEAGITTRVDDKGFAEVHTRLPRGAASRMRGGPCGGHVAASFEVEVRIDPARFTRSCVRVSAEAEVAVVVTGTPLATPGSAVEVEILRRPEARGRAVLVEAITGGRAIAFSWIDGRSSRGSLTLPDDLLGVVQIRARALRAPNATEARSEPGAIAFGVGAFDGLLVRPPDAFALSVAPERPRYLVRERANVNLVASQSGARGWAALLVRDVAAHGGESPWDLRWMRGALHEAAQQPADEVNARFLRASLTGAMSVDPRPPLPPELEAPYWRSRRHHQPYRPGAQTGRGVLRDPTALREELLRRGIGRFEMVLEQAVWRLGTNAEERAALIRGRAFHPDAIANVAASQHLHPNSLLTLGGQPVTVAMIRAADPSFSLSTVGRRVARAKLSKLLLALVRLSDPDNPNAQRASANLPPERWLGTLVRLGMVQPADLVDPWGHAFVFRRVRSRPRIAISLRALDWELASPGPDGRIGTADDVKDPFARAVPEGTPYAIASGEEQLLRRIATLTPTNTVLTRMGQAYQRLSLAASEEQRVGPVSASGSEMADEEIRLQTVDREGLGGLGLRGSGRGGGGSGSGYGMGVGRRGPAAASPAPLEEATAEAEYAYDADGIMDSADARSQSRVAQLGTLVREDFPATLFFVGEVSLEGGRAQIEVPLADALTSYHLEAIAWTASGWTTSGASRLSVDQRALVDAPTPPYATVGDTIRLPVRVENRTDEPLDLRIVVEAEGELSIDRVAPVDLSLAAREAQESIVELSLRQPGEGELVVSIESGGEGIDAVRRPLNVLADARTARDRRVELVDSRSTIEIEVPAEASERGPGQIRLAVGARLFGGIEQVGHLWAGWTLTMSGEPLTEASQREARSWVSYEDEDRELLREPLRSALALGALWRDEAVMEADARRALRAISRALPAREALRDTENFGDQPAWILLALAPIAQHLDARPALREPAVEILERFREIVALDATRRVDAPSAWARGAAALILSGGSQARAEELIRRAERHVVRVGDMAWLEPEGAGSGAEPRAEPTALLALAHVGLGARGEALSFVRALVDMHRAGAPPPPPWIVRGDICPPPYFGGRDLALASAAAGRLTMNAVRHGDGEARVLLDGHVVETTREGGVSVAVLEGIGAAGTHRITVELPANTVALAYTAFAYGMPWDVAPRRRGALEVSIDGERGARDTRAALIVTVRNRGSRIATRPIVEIELPAGSELDEPTRDALRSLLRADAHMEGRTLILPLRALAPGAWTRIPLRARWALSGTLRGLGAVAYDGLGPMRAEVLPIAILPSQAVELPDEGPEPDPPDLENAESGPGIPPIELLGRLVPEEG